MPDMDTTTLVIVVLVAICAVLAGVHIGSRSHQGTDELASPAASGSVGASGDQLSRAELIDVARAAASDAARVAASEALGASQQSFMTLAKGEMKHLREGLDGQLELSHSKFAALTESVDKQLKQVDQQLQIFDRQRSESHGEMIGQIRGLHRSQEAIRLEAEQLRVALRKPSVRGRWGEMTLRRVVELAGMSPHTDFVEQHTTTHDGSGQRPDLIINMAGGRHVIVDAKCTLDAYLDAVEAADEAARKQHERRHAQQMAKHVSQLAGKSYWASMDESPDFVVMFVPGDTFLTAALEANPNLMDEAMGQNVVIATPSTLLALLRTVAYGWKQERLAAQAAEIWAMSKELHGRLSVFAGHFGRIGKQLDSAVSHYNKAVSSFDRRVMVTARRIEDAHMSSEKELVSPEQIHTSAATVESRPTLNVERLDHDDPLLRSERTPPAPRTHRLDPFASRAQSTDGDLSHAGSDASNSSSEVAAERPDIHTLERMSG